jgi:adenylate cyclase
MDSFPRPINAWLVPVLLLALGVFVILFDGLGLQSGLSNRLFDAYQRHAARPFADMEGAPVRVLELPSFDEDLLVQVTRTLSAQGTRMIVFTAPVQFGPSPQSLSARLPPGSDAARAALAALPEPGHELAQVIAETRAVLPVMLGVAGREPHVKAHFTYRGTRDPFRFAPRAGAAAAPSAMLESNAAGVAAANLEPDADGVVRRMPIAFRLGTGLIPGMAADVLRLTERRSEITVVSDEHDPLSFISGIGIAGLETSKGLIPTDKGGRIWLRYGAGSRPLDLAALTAAPLKDAIVVVGLAGKVVETPLGPASTASVIADSVENLLGGLTLTRPGWAKLAEALLLAGVGVAMVFLLRLGLGWAAVLVLTSGALSGLASWYFYVRHGLLLDWATPVLFLGLSFVSALLVWFHDLQLTYASLRSAFSNSLPRETIEKIARQPDLLKPEGQKRTITCLVCGAPGAEQKTLAALIDQVLEHGGTLDRTSADGFAAFWNAPLDDADHARHACEAANGLAAVAADAGQQISVGLATGEVIAGSFPAGYGVRGDVPLLAERIRSLAHRYGAPLLAADETRTQAEHNFAFLEIDTIASGTGNATLYALMGDRGVLVSPKFRALTVFHDHLFQAIRKQNWRLARDLITQCRRLSGANQALYDLHLARITYYERNPPGMDWDGAFRPILE